MGKPRRSENTPEREVFPSPVRPAGLGRQGREKVWNGIRGFHGFCSPRPPGKPQAACPQATTDEGAGSLVRTRGPAGVTATVCSKWADSLPSARATAPPSARVLVRQPPALTIGSVGTTTPASGGGARPARP